MKRLALVLACVLASAACGDDNPSGPTDGQPGDGSGSNVNATLSSYVIDLVTNHTTATEAARPYSEFSALPDPDGEANNLTAYMPLF